MVLRPEPPLARLRRSRGLTQAELGTLIGWTQQRVSDIELTPIERLETGTLARYLAGLDAELRLDVVFPNDRWLIPLLLPQPGGVGGQAGVGEDPERLPRQPDITPTG